MFILCLLLFIYNTKTNNVKWVFISPSYVGGNKLNNLHKMISSFRTKIYINVFMIPMPMKYNVSWCLIFTTSRKIVWRTRGSDQWNTTVMLRNTQERTRFFLRHKANPLNMDYFLISPLLILLGRYFEQKWTKYFFPDFIYFFFFRSQNSHGTIWIKMKQANKHHLQEK